MSTALPKLQQAISKAQSLTGEQITIGGVTVTGIVRTQKGSQSIAPGGFREGINMQVSLPISAFTAQPSVGTIAVARGQTFRIFDVDQTYATYEVTLETPKK